VWAQGMKERRRAESLAVVHSIVLRLELSLRQGRKPASLD
jgi:hypothetical protein